MATKTPDYTINYDDERFTSVESDKQEALTKNEELYGGMIDSSDKFYQDLRDETHKWGEEQAKLQQERTDFTIEKIEQQKEQARQDYIKEQSGAYADWQKQSNQYGGNAEAMAAQGLAKSGYSETTQASYYNAYQNRVAVARDGFERAVLNYDNLMTEARLTNNEALAQIAHDTFMKELEYALEGFHYKNDLLIKKSEAERDIDNTYYTRWQDVLSQMNTENALAENARQFNLTYDENKRQFDEEIRLEREKFDEDIRQFDLELERLKNKDDADSKARAAELQEQKDARIQAHEEWLAEMELAKSDAGGGGGGGGGGGSDDDGGVYVSPKADDTKDDTTTTQDKIAELLGYDLPIDWTSWGALGYGPRTAEEMDKLIRSGEVEEYVEDGKIKFRRRGKTGNYALDLLANPLGNKTGSKTGSKTGGGGGSFPKSTKTTQSK